MTPHLLRKIIFIIQTSTAVYITGEGAICPVCEKLLNERRRAVVNRTDASGVRFCSCRHCLSTFKAIGEADPGQSPETVDVKPKKRQTRTRKG